MFQSLMQSIIIIAGFAAAFAASYYGVEAFRRWSLRREIVDHPNDRSSHREPTPRGGGAVILVITLCLFTAFSVAYSGVFPWGFLAGAIIIGAASWLDDLFSVPSYLRLAAHFIGAGLVMLQFGPFRYIYLPIVNYEFATGIFGSILTLLFIVWLVNAFNFMDGIDGMAALQAAIAGLGWLIYGSAVGLPSTAFLGGVAAFSCIGFLIHNWQPARIFLGDVGSSFLGFTFASASLIAASEVPNLSGKLPIIGTLFVWLIFLDAAITFLKRLIGKRPFWRPHREHFYQRHIISGKSHASVSKIYGLASSFITGITILALLGDGNLEIAAFASAVILPILVFRQPKKNVDVNI